ncbi:MAG: ISAzo13 family transposase, partial [Fibrobacterota bacterium]
MESVIVEKYVSISGAFNERGRRLWAATESRAIGYGGDALVSRATGLSRQTIRNGRREISKGV